MIVSDFENIINDLESRKEKMKNIFEMSNTNVERINETDVWTSPTEREFYSKYNELSSNYSVIIEGLEKHIKFLRNTLNSYKTNEETRRSDIVSNSVTLDVNS